MVRPYAVKWMKQQKKRQKKESSEHVVPPLSPSEDEVEELPVVEEHIEEEKVKNKKRKDKKKNIDVDKPKEEEDGDDDDGDDDEEDVKNKKRKTDKKKNIEVSKPKEEDDDDEVNNKKRKKDKKKNIEIDKQKEEEDDDDDDDDDDEKENQKLGKKDTKIDSNTENKLIGFSSPLDMLPGLPSAVAPVDKSQLPGVIFVVEKASLRVGKVGKKEQILSGDEHATFLTRQKLNPADFRPDIVHQVLLSILDRPLTKAGRLTALYVKTDDGELFEVKPHVRLPRTFRRFSGLMYQLKSVKHIHASGKRENLFRMIKNPVTRHLPANACKIGFSYNSEKLVKMKDYVAAASDDVPLVFVVGAMAHGKIDADYTDDLISVSEYPLSGACCVSRVCEALEQKWNII